MQDDKICPDEIPCVEMPSAMDMAKNLMKDGSAILKNALSGNQTIADDEVREHRWAICQACPKLHNDRCTECGCFMKIKVAFTTTACPLEKW